MNSDKVKNIHTMTGRLGEYVLITDLQKMMYKDSVNMQRDGHDVGSQYAENFADNLGKVIKQN
jgi:hypothetical protein